MPDNTLPKDNFYQRVLQAVYSIPYGKVATYGEIARQAGSSRAARQVGGILKKLPEDSSLPWFRIVNRHGRISLTGDDYQRQYQALIAEGIVFSKDGRIDLQQFGYFS
ncbi:MGMT family protein [Entomomonas sp. E2T0]|uniref:MGMT family protein n=1 Tax=Entomomonas sp. E2T0 TaxID=2930213 RepID=UPI0022282841|nr:MGMT family protein [Entomomonas sp. E2T0]UYZ83246.1 MGMT family protein [Entomomonas sp. E2T0]